MKILLTGANGQLGREIARQGHEHKLVLMDSDTLDMTNGAAVRAYFQKVQQQAIIHFAAYTNVDRAETDANGAFRVNPLQNVVFLTFFQIGSKLLWKPRWSFK